MIYRVLLLACLPRYAVLSQSGHCIHVDSAQKHRCAMRQQARRRLNRLHAPGLLLASLYDILLHRCYVLWLASVNGKPFLDVRFVHRRVSSLPADKLSDQ